MVSTDKLLVALLAGLHWGVEEPSKLGNGPEASQGQGRPLEPCWVWHHRDDSEVCLLLTKLFPPNLTGY